MYSGSEGSRHCNSRKRMQIDPTQAHLREPSANNPNDKGSVSRKPLIGVNQTAHCFTVCDSWCYWGRLSISGVGGWATLGLLVCFNIDVLTRMLCITFQCPRERFLLVWCNGARFMEYGVCILLCCAFFFKCCVCVVKLMTFLISLNEILRLRQMRLLCAKKLTIVRKFTYTF